MVKDLYVGTAGQYLHDINVCLTGIGRSREEWAKVCIDGCGWIATTMQVCVTIVTFRNPHQCIPESSASFPSPQAQSRNPTLIPDSERLFPIMLDHSRPDRAQPNRLYLSLVKL